MSNKVRNTSEHACNNPGATLAGMLLAGGDGFFEAMEARGQMELVNSDVLPSEIDAASRTALTTAGVVFGAPVQGDDLFVYATLPHEWKKVPTDHPMWSKLVDEHGRERAGIFYKAAYYDRRSNMHATQRYTYNTNYSGPEYERDVRFTRVLDGGKEVFRTKEVQCSKGDHEALRAMEKEALAWLEQHYPNYNDPGAYWNEP